MKAVQFNIGAKILCTDQPCGKLAKAVVDPETEQVTELIVERGRLLKKQRHAVAVSLVESTTEKAVQLTIDSDELKSYPEYKEMEVEQRKTKFEQPRFHASHYRVVVREPVLPSVEHEIERGVPEEYETIGRGTSVRNPEGEIGSVDHLLIDEESEGLQYIVVKHGGVAGVLAEYLVIAEDQIIEIDEEAITVAVPDDAIDDLPRYEPRDEDELLSDLKERLKMESPDYDLSDVEIAVDDSIVRLTGAVASDEACHYAEALMAATDGVIHVENELTVEA